MSIWMKRICLSFAALGLLFAAPINALEPPGLQGPAVPGEIIVGLHPGVGVGPVAAALNASGVRSLGGGGAFLLEIEDDAIEAVARARRVPGVGYAEPNYIRSLYGPDDPDYDLKWGLHNDGTLCSANDPSDCATLDADMDWDEAFGDAGLEFFGPAVIAVLDTGADLGHPDLSAKLTAGWDYFDNDNDPTDDYGHGTNVAGIAAAETHNSTGTAGVAWLANVQVMPLKVCGWIQTLFGLTYGCPDDAIISAINHAIDNGADVINMSLGGGSRSKAQENAVNDAWNAGLVIVASSGNDGSDRKVSYPAAYAKAMAVGATDWNDVRVPYSNGGNALDVVAPGGRMVYYHDLGGIYSTMPTYDVTLTQAPYAYSKNYDQLQGTSMSAPQVAGLAALLFAQGHANADVRALIESTADDLGADGWDKFYGHGRINVYAALRGTLPPPGPEPDPTPSAEVGGVKGTVRLNGSGVNGALVEADSGESDMTNKPGKYRMNVSDSATLVTATSELCSASEQVTVVPGQTVTVDLNLICP